MKVSFEKQMKGLEREVLLKSVDLDDDIEDFNFELDNYESNDRIIAVSPNCVRCNLCVEECPVNAIEPPNIFRKSKITDKCVKCEICVQSCPISCIKSVNTFAFFDSAKEDSYFNYTLSNKEVSHRTLRMNDIKVDLDNCTSCGNCAEFCPTKALTLEFSSYFDGFDLDEDKLYPAINKDLCIGCGSCSNLCPENVIYLDRILGPIIDTCKLLINQDLCVNCYLCEENCPVEAIKLVDGEVVLDKDKCIRCNACTTRCPVGALHLTRR